mmetsp:Transcript_101945/g.179482  ORF Transcript_101945/g.179482 Transcript_101945/m.179482 type:complete len:426 (+) Transcript_101945:89-1366(+)
METITGWIGLSENTLKTLKVKGGCEDHEAEQLMQTPRKTLKGGCFQNERPKLCHSRSADNLEGNMSGTPRPVACPTLLRTPFPIKTMVATGNVPISQQLAMLHQGKGIDRAHARHGSSCVLDRNLASKLTPRARARSNSRSPVPPHPPALPALQYLPPAAPAAPPSTRSTSRSPVPVSAACQTCNLQIGQQRFDPTHPTMKSTILSRLGIGAHASIECHGSNHGGLNEGVWTVKDPAQPSQELVLKLVSAHRGEGDIFANLARQHPGICSDPLLTFPKVVFHCLGARGEKRYDLIAMRRAPGISLAEFLAQKHFTKQMSEILRVLTKIGSCLGEFHSQYNDAQHGDFQTSNIFYDEATDKVTFIDFAGMGAKAKCCKTDVEFFVNALRICAATYGQQLLTDGARHFEVGYRMHRAFGCAPGLVSI